MQFRRTGALINSKGIPNEAGFVLLLKEIIPAAASLNRKISPGHWGSSQLTSQSSLIRAGLVRFASIKVCENCKQKSGLISVV